MLNLCTHKYTCKNMCLCVFLLLCSVFYAMNVVDTDCRLSYLFSGTTHTYKRITVLRKNGRDRERERMTRSLKKYFQFMCMNMRKYLIYSYMDSTHFHTYIPEYLLSQICVNVGVFCINVCIHTYL